MSAILGIAGPLARSTEPPVVARMLAAMTQRGADCRGVDAGGLATLGASRHAWELERGWSGAALVVREDKLTAVADATLYYLADLERALSARGVRATGDTPSHFILAAYRAWGTECASHLEGDFAFVVWDARAHTLFAARDFGGKRPLHHTRIGESILVASTIGALRSHPDCSSRLDAVVIAEEAAALTGSSDGTVWCGIERLPPGHSLTWLACDAGVRVAAHWQAPAFRDRGGDSLDHAAEELRALIGDAVAERLAMRGPTALALSGGWDSPAVFATASHLLREQPERGPLRPVSVSFPVGDPGREDELIQSITGHWGEQTCWIPSGEVPALDRLSDRAAERDEPFPHPFEPMSRAIARAGVGEGAAVVLDGNGGDQLFEVSSIYLADLARRGHWLELAREWRARGGGVTALVRDALLPALPNSVLRVGDALAGGRVLVDAGLGRRPPRWLRDDFVRTHDLIAGERGRAPLGAGRTLAATETAWQFTRPVLGRMAAALASFTLDEGAEHRSPLYDGRIIRFAASRPASDRRRGRETKRLLRRAMAGLLPPEILAPRAFRTGVPIGYLVAAIRAALPQWSEGVLRRPMLADLGIIEPSALRAACDACIAGHDAHLTVALYLTLQTELWLRAHTPASAGRTPGDRDSAVTTAASQAGRGWPEDFNSKEGIDVRNSEAGAVRHLA